jgi:hypothetical protein
LICCCSGQKNSGMQKAKKHELHDRMIAEELQTPAKRADLLKLAEVLSQNISVKNNHFIFKLNKREFKKTGLPREYYHKIERELKRNNEFIDANNLNADELLKSTEFFKGDR